MRQQPSSDLIGKIGRVTGRIAPGEIGEVMIAVRGGTSAYHAYPADGVTRYPDRGEGAGHRLPFTTNGFRRRAAGISALTSSLDQRHDRGDLRYLRFPHVRLVARAGIEPVLE